MDWIKIILFVCLILQEVQIILLNKKLDGIEDLLVASLVDKIKEISVVFPNKDNKNKDD